MTLRPQFDHSLRWERELIARSAVVMGIPQTAGGWLYFELRRTEWPVARVMRVREGEGLAQAETVVDPERFVAGGVVSGWQVIGGKVLAGIADGTEFGRWRVIDPDTGKAQGDEFGQCRNPDVAYEVAGKGRTDRLYHVVSSDTQVESRRHLMVREGVANTGSPGADVRVELPPFRWGSSTILAGLSVVHDGDDRWLVVNESMGVGQARRTSVYDLNDPRSLPHRPHRTAYMDVTTCGAQKLDIVGGWAYFQSTDDGRQPYGATFRAPVRELGDRTRWKEVVPADAAHQAHQIDFSIEADRIVTTWRRHGADHITIRRLTDGPDGGKAGDVLEEIRSPGSPHASIGGQVLDLSSGHGRHMVAWVDTGGPRILRYGRPDGGRTPHEWAVSRDVGETRPRPVDTVTTDVPFRFGELPHQTGVARVTAPRAAAGAGPLSAVLVDRYPYYGYVQGGLSAQRTMYNHMVDDAVHAAGGATVAVYHDHPRPGADGVAEFTDLYIGAAEALVSRGMSEPRRMLTMGGSAQAHPAAEAVRRRPDLFTGAVIRSGLLRLDRVGLSRGVGFCQGGANAFGPNPETINPYARMKDQGFEMPVGAQRPLLMLAFGTQDTRTLAQDHSLPYARVATAAGAEVHTHRYAGGHFVQWLPHGGAEAFGTPLARMEASMGGFRARPHASRLESAVLVAAARGMASAPFVPATDRGHTERQRPEAPADPSSSARVTRRGVERIPGLGWFS